MSRFPALLITLLAILLGLDAPSTLAEHQICNWDLRTRDPGIAGGWDTFCTAWPLPMSAENGSYTYICEDNPALTGHGRKVGTWNVLKGQTLEMGAYGVKLTIYHKPCWHGFAEHHHAPAKCSCWHSMAVCPYPADRFPTCFGWDQHDDCELLINGAKPDYLIIYGLSKYTMDGWHRCGPQRHLEEQQQRPPQQEREEQEQEKQPLVEGRAGPGERLPPFRHVNAGSAGE